MQNRHTYERLNDDYDGKILMLKMVSPLILNILLNFCLGDFMLLCCYNKKYSCLLTFSKLPTRLTFKTNIQSGLLVSSNYDDLNTSCHWIFLRSLRKHFEYLAF